MLVAIGCVLYFLVVLVAFSCCALSGKQAEAEERREAADVVAPCPQCGCADDVTCLECAATKERAEAKYRRALCVMQRTDSRAKKNERDFEYGIKRGENIALECARKNTAGYKGVELCFFCAFEEECEDGQDVRALAAAHLAELRPEPS